MRRRAGRGRLVSGAAILGILALVAIFSPVIATDRPLARTLAGTRDYPALEAWAATLMERPRGMDEPGEPAGGDVIAAPIPYAPAQIDLRARLEPPSARHWLGTDELGRDLLARLIHGSRISLLVGISAAAFSLLIGVLLGGVAAYVGGWVDIVISRMVDVVIAFPFLVLLLALVAVLSPGVGTIILALALTAWPAEARLVRGEVLRLRELEYAIAARATGAGAGRVLFRHLLPNAIQPALVSASFGISAAIMVESAISFLGFGIPPPFASWGSILSSADEHLRQAWWLAVFPGLAIFLTIVAGNLLGEGLRQRLETRR